MPRRYALGWNAPTPKRRPYDPKLDDGWDLPFIDLDAGEPVDPRLLTPEPKLPVPKTSGTRFRREPITKGEYDALGGTPRELQLGRDSAQSRVVFAGADPQAYVQDYRLSEQYDADNPTGEEMARQRLDNRVCGEDEAGDSDMVDAATLTHAADDHGHDQPADEDEDEDQHILATIDDLVEMYRAKIDRLPPRQKQAWLLYQTDVPKAVIARQMRITRQAVDNHLADARRALNTPDPVRRGPKGKQKRPHKL